MYSRVIIVLLLCTYSHVLKASQMLKLNDKPSSSLVFRSFWQYFGVYSIVNDQREREVYNIVLCTTDSSHEISCQKRP
jgi:hypothetical protein